MRNYNEFEWKYLVDKLDYQQIATYAFANEWGRIRFNRTIKKVLIMQPTAHIQVRNLSLPTWYQQVCGWQKCHVISKLVVDEETLFILRIISFINEAQPNVSLKLKFWAIISQNPHSTHGVIIACPSSRRLSQTTTNWRVNNLKS